jgi:cation transport protein ChaC
VTQGRSGTGLGLGENWRQVVTREALRDGSLLAAARRLMPPGTEFLSDAEIEADLDATLSQHDFAESRTGAVHGWHRRFCLWLHGGRGSPDNPGLMLALERGGCCAGLLFRIPAADARSELLLAWRRELFTGAYQSRWVTATTTDGPVRAVTFVANRAHLRYAGRLDDMLTATHIATATGSLGSCAAYLLLTLEALRAAGLRDRRLERLWMLVGERQG